MRGLPPGTSEGLQVSLALYAHLGEASLSFSHCRIPSSFIVL